MSAVGGAGDRNLGRVSDVTGDEPRITLIGKPGCHLCDDARLIVKKIADETGTEWKELSILEHPDLAETYWEQIPVVLVDGAQHTYWRVDEDRLRTALTRRRGLFSRRNR
ncbi:glutaredoxin family protein [Kineosporia babensis]|uniref:Glutaredoxin family protein n=1 Tax=Kineosporia babensis TaxID=499548 RepID=A0A9X1SV31_9ACTN|nr:glutaredoxin family protein [Kineosporia babensis]